MISHSFITCPEAIHIERHTFKIFDLHHDIKIPEYYSAFENDNTQVVYNSPCSKDIKCTVFNKYMCISKNDIEITIHYAITITFNFTNPCVPITTSLYKYKKENTS